MTNPAGNDHRTAGTAPAASPAPPAPATSRTAEDQDPGLPLVIGHAEMDDALQHGLAVALTESIGWVMRYRAAWWVLYEEGWLRVIPGEIEDNINQLYPGLAAADAAAQADGARARQTPEPRTVRKV